MQMVSIGCGIKLKCHTLRALLISFFHWMMAESQVRTAEKVDLGGCGSVSSQALFGHGDEEDRDASYKLSLEEEPGVPTSQAILGCRMRALFSASRNSEWQEGFPNRLCLD